MYENVQETSTISPQGRAPHHVVLGIVILSYNTVDLLKACLTSVMASELDVAYKVCVVDNASTDGSAEMVRRCFPQVKLITNHTNVGYSAGNNIGLRWLGVSPDGAERSDVEPPPYLLLLNPDTILPKHALSEMLRFLDEHPAAGIAGPRVRRPDGSLDRACRRSFPTPAVSFYRMLGLSRLFPNSKRFNAYNLDFWPEDAVHQVDSVVGAFMMLRCDAVAGAGLLDEQFFMYGEDLDWAKRIKQAGWEVWYNGRVEITHVKEAASSQSSKSRIDFYEAMWLFYHKHYRPDTPWYLDRLIVAAIALKGGIDVARHLWRFCRGFDGHGQDPAGKVQPHIASLRQRPSNGVSQGGS